MATTYGAPTGLDLSACSVTATGSSTSQTLANLGKAVSDNATAVATAQRNASSAQNDAATALSTATAAQTTANSALQPSNAGVLGGYAEYDPQSGYLRVEELVQATLYTPPSAGITLNPAATAANGSQSEIVVNSANGASVTSSTISFFAQNKNKTHCTFDNTFESITCNTDAYMDIGTTNTAFNNCYLKTAPTVTSDANEKTIIGSLADTTYVDGQKLLAAADAVEAKVYQLNISIAEKGAANARLHIGYIAQEWETALKNAGLDAAKMGLLISFPLTERVEKTATDANGKTVTYYETVPVYEADGKTQKIGYSLRYAELQCLLLEARKQKQIALEARIAALEAKVAA